MPLATAAGARDDGFTHLDHPAPLDRRSIPLGVRLVETVKEYWDLGFTAFGGPGVHVVILRKRLVPKWVDETTFTDLFSLGNALPGPGSTQLAFALVVVRNGTLAGFLAFLIWSIPGAVGMAALGAGVRKFPERLPPIVLALLTGLNASAVGLIALAAYQLSKTAITDLVTRLLVLLSASFGICYHAPWMYPVLVFSGGLITLLFDFRRQILGRLPDMLNPYAIQARRQTAASEPEPVQDPNYDIELESLGEQRRSSTGRDGVQTTTTWEDDKPRGAEDQAADTVHATLRQRNGPSVQPQPAPTPASTVVETPTSERSTPMMVLNRKIAFALGAGFIVYLVSIIVVRSQLNNPPRALDFFTNMVIGGTIIFGGGPVVIPLLRQYTVQPGWVESRDFLLGFAILQAFPGPNFNFAVYLGVLSLPHNPVLGAFLGWVGIFSPGVILKLALLPLYHTWRKHAVAISVLRGLNAAAVGLVYTAVWQLFLVGYIYTPVSGKIIEQASASGPLTSDPFWGVVASFAFVATQWYKTPPAVTIVCGALAGLAWFGVVGPAGVERQQFLS
ncbi:chromate transmembrane transporter [Rhodotorula toruloides]|uniref:Chromate transmembrane transporter n=1 Tax=Rhodotorula toruloides TaxID=5286 RepID=A0A511KQG5_RHOTO|nr:chromate transmembrane transporter [Rhodotorula toruloides]